VEVGEAMLVALARATSKTSNFLETRTDLKSAKASRHRMANGLLYQKIKLLVKNKPNSDT
jgi:hypothetical protein